MDIPQWLDGFIFNDLEAKYCRSNTDMTVIDWDKSNMLNYLGTYFPRSYVEAYCIFSDLLGNDSAWFSDKEEISLFDFACGTGGEIIGLLTAISEKRPNIRTVNVCAIDGNEHALRLYDKVVQKFQEHTQININNNSSPIKIDDFYDLSILNSVLDKKFDIVISFKAICEFVTKQQFERQNPYKHIAEFLLQKLNDKGLILLVDVTTYNNVSQEWLPQMMDNGLSAVNCKIICKNDGYNQTYTINHSRKNGDISKVAWRMIIN